MALRVVSAQTVNPNTPETDKMKEVVHMVTLSNGVALFLPAECPIDAINRANKIVEGMDE